MPEKQNLYDILGLSSSATTPEIEHAFALCKATFESDTTIEDRRNRLAFIQHARDVLIDPQKRARYDLQLQQQTEIIVEDGAMPTSSRLRGIALLVLLGGLAWAWHHYQGQSSQSTSVSPVSSARTPDSGTDTALAQNAPLEDNAITATKTETGATPSASSGRPSPQNSYVINTDSADAEIVKKLVWSVYGIVGPRAFGTGILVDNEGLLTNCHVLAANMPLSGKIYAINAVTKDHAEITEVAFLENQDACLVHAPGLTGQAVEVGSTTWMTTGVKTHNVGYANGRLTASQGEFITWINKYGQSFLVTSNFCDHGVSGGPLVDDDGRLIGLTTGGNKDRSRCASLTVETVRSLRFQSSIPIGDFSADYVSNIVRRTW